MPDKDSPFWSILKVTLRSLVLLLGLWLFYDRMDRRDAMTLLMCIAADGAITTVARMFTKDKPER